MSLLKQLRSGLKRDPEKAPPPETAIFTVQHATPGQIRDHSGTGVARALRAALPFSVEVYLPPEDRAVYDTPCGCKKVYRLTDEAVAALKKRGLFLKANEGRTNPCVCNCMGSPDER
jgi:hypothetical protein